MNLSAAVAALPPTPTTADGKLIASRSTSASSELSRPRPSGEVIASSHDFTTDATSTVFLGRSSLESRPKGRVFTSGCSPGVLTVSSLGSVVRTTTTPGSGSTAARGPCSSMLAVRSAARRCLTRTEVDLVRLPAGPSPFGVHRLSTQFFPGNTNSEHASSMPTLRPAPPVVASPIHLCEDAVLLDADASMPVSCTTSPRNSSPAEGFIQPMHQRTSPSSRQRLSAVLQHPDSSSPLECTTNMPASVSTRPVSSFALTSLPGNWNQEQGALQIFASALQPDQAMTASRVRVGVELGADIPLLQGQARNSFSSTVLSGLPRSTGTTSLGHLDSLEKLKPGPPVSSTLSCSCGNAVVAEASPTVATLSPPPLPHLPLESDRNGVTVSQCGQSQGKSCMAPKQRHVWSFREFPGGTAESDPLRIAYLLRPPGSFTLQVVGRPLWAAAAATTCYPSSGNCKPIVGPSVNDTNGRLEPPDQNGASAPRTDSCNAWALSNASVELLSEPPIQVLVAPGGVNQFRAGLPMQKTFVLGRTFQELNTVPLEARRWFSRRHCAIRWTLERAGASTFSVCDLGSSNGTFVNGRQLPGSRKVYLKSGDIIGVSMTEEGQLLLGFRFSVDAYSARIQGVGISGRLDEPRGWAVSTWQPATWKESVEPKETSGMREEKGTSEVQSKLMKVAETVQPGSNIDSVETESFPTYNQRNAIVAVKLPHERPCQLGESCEDSTGSTLVQGLEGLRSSLEVAQAS